MANYPKELAQDAVCQSHTGHMTGFWFLPTRPLRLSTNERMNNLHFYCFTVHFCSLSSLPTYALIYIIKILSQAVILVALFTPTCFDTYGSSSGSTTGPC